MAAAEAGVGAGVVAYLPELGALVLDFIEGSTMSAEDLRRGDRLREVAEACRELHACRPFRDDFNMFRVQERYVGIVQERGLRLPERYLEFAPQVRGSSAPWRCATRAPCPATTTSWPRTSSGRATASA